MKNAKQIARRHTILRLRAPVGAPRRSLRTAALFACGVLAPLLIAGCDQKSNQPQARLVPNQAPEIAAPAADAPDEVAVLANPSFTNPIMLRLARDSFAADQVAASMHGVTSRPADGSAYLIANLAPCHDTLDSSQDLSFDVRLDVYSFSVATLKQWVVQKGFVQIHSYPIQYTQPEDGQLNGTTRTYTCAVVQDTIRQYLPPQLRTGDIHDGIDVPLFQRVFVAWTYRNRYEANPLGMGKIKIFAGTFTYKLNPNIPGPTPAGLGTATVKAELNPDTGRWQIDNMQLQDPAATLQ